MPNELKPIRVQDSQILYYNSTFRFYSTYDSEPPPERKRNLNNVIGQLKSLTFLKPITLLNVCFASKQWKTDSRVDNWRVIKSVCGEGGVDLDYKGKLFRKQ